MYVKCKKKCNVKKNSQKLLVIFTIYWIKQFWSTKTEIQSRCGHLILLSFSLARSAILSWSFGIISAFSRSCPNFSSMAVSICKMVRFASVSPTQQWYTSSTLEFSVSRILSWGQGTNTLNLRSLDMFLYKSLSNDLSMHCNKAASF